jgi:hypothetical protein
MRDGKSCAKRLIYCGILALAILILTARTVHPQAGSQSSEDRTEAGVMKVMREWLEALQTRDMKTLELILGDEWTDNSKSGIVYTRKDFFSGPLPTAPRVSTSAPSAGRVTRYFENAHVRLYGDVAIVTGTVVSESGRPEPSGSAQTRTIFTDALVWREERWQAVTSQETAVPTKAN